MFHRIEVDGCKNNPETSSTVKVSEYIFHQVFQCLQYHHFKSIENKHDVYRGNDWMKKFCKFLREHAMGIINFKNNKIKLLTNEQQNVKKQKFVIFVDKNFKINML